MYNYFMVIGVVLDEPKVQLASNGRNVCYLTLGIRRSFRNVDGQYEFDNLCVQLWTFLADIAGENLKKGAKVSIKGRIARRVKKLDNGEYSDNTYLIGENIILLSSVNQEMYEAPAGEVYDD